MDIKRVSCALALAAFLCLASLAWPAASSALEVNVLKPAEEGVSPNQQRLQARDLGFLQAVVQTARGLLPEPLSEERLVLLEKYLAASAGKYVQGYKEVSAETSDQGLNLVLEVDVNRGELRKALQDMGLFMTGRDFESYCLRPGPGLTEADLQAIAEVSLLVGLRQAEGPYPCLELSRDPDGRLKGLLRVGGREWRSEDHNAAALWFTLWRGYFSGRTAASARSEDQVLKVSGWFAPDGAQEFDSVLRGWEGVVEDVRLIELDMQPSGIVGSWEIRVVNGAALETRLRQYLSARGLNFSLPRSDG
ncbi:MAG: hypothetical protein JW718_07910 [Desulfovibrionaceae bacterium]|nr:hypothetical protein [Desulfovibrionaceae bacterium]